MPESRESCSHPPAAELAAGLWIAVPGDFVIVDQETGRSERKTEYYRAPTPSKAYEYGKFYTVHLQDATAEEREVIETHLGKFFTFLPDGRVGWKSTPN